MKSGVARRVLFLSIGRALAAQTVRAFASFEAEPGLKFDKIYPVYSQRFQQTDFDETRSSTQTSMRTRCSLIRSLVMPSFMLHDPKNEHSTIR